MSVRGFNTGSGVEQYDYEYLDNKPEIPTKKSDIGLGNVDNTSDLDKPISNATQTALNEKVPNTRKVNGKALSADVTLTSEDIGYDASTAYGSGTVGKELTELNRQISEQEERTTNGFRSLAQDGSVSELNTANMFPDKTFGDGLWGAVNGSLTIENYGNEISKKCLFTRTDTGRSGYLAIVMRVSDFVDGETYRISISLLKDSTTFKMAVLQNTNGIIGNTNGWVLADVAMINDSHSASKSTFHYDWTFSASAFGNYEYAQIQFKCTNDSNWFVEPFIGLANENTDYIVTYKIPPTTETLTPINLFEGEFYTDHYYGGTTGQYTEGSGYCCSKPQLLKAGTYLCLINKQYFGASANNKVFSFPSNDGTAGGTAVVPVTLLQEISFPSEAGSTAQIVHAVYAFTIAEDAYIGVNIGHGTVDPTVFMLVNGSTMNDWPVSYLYNFDPYTVIVEPSKLNQSMMAQVSKIYGKKVAVNGDSICEGAGELGGFIKQVAGKNAMQAYNIGVGGGTLVTGTTWSNTGADRHWISSTIKDMEPNCDYYIFEGGVNDYAQSIPVGELTNSYPLKGASDDNLDTTTIIGAMEYACRDLVTLFQGKKCGFIFVHGIFPLSGSGAAWHTQYKPGMISALKKWGVPYLDLEEEAPPLNLIPSLKSVYTYNGDGWHPNAAGYAAFYTDKIRAWMESL